MSEYDIYWKYEIDPVYSQDPANPVSNSQALSEEVSSEAPGYYQKFDIKVALQPVDLTPVAPVDTGGVS